MDDRTAKGHAGWTRQRERQPMHLDDLEQRLGGQVAPIRAALAGETDLAVVLAHDPTDGDDVVLVATRRGLHVRQLCPDASLDTRPTREPSVAPWATVRVSPVRIEGWRAPGTQPDARATHSCEVRVGQTLFHVSADGLPGQAAVDSFHDEVVRRGTPWHYPA